MSKRKKGTVEITEETKVTEMPENPEDIVLLPDDMELVGDHQNIQIDKNYVNVSFWKDALKRFRANRLAVVALIAILVIVALAVIGPNMNDHTYASMITDHANLPPRIPGLEKLGIFNGVERGTNVYEDKGLGDVYYWFGTDTLGRDLWTRTWTGTRVSLIIALFAALGDLIIGVSYGMISGFIGGKADIVMQRIIEILNGIPNLVIMTLMVMILSPGLVTIIIALLITGWIGMSRMVRGQAMKLKEEEYILASRTLGTPTRKIIVKDILPNIFGQIIVMTMFSIPGAIFAESFLAFVGLGLPQPRPSLGILISEGYKTLTIHPHMLVIPVLVLAILMLSFNLLADGLRDAVDPKMKDK